MNLLPTEQLHTGQAHSGMLSARLTQAHCGERSRWAGGTGASGWLLLVLLGFVALPYQSFAREPPPAACPAWTRGIPAERCPPERFLCGLGVVSNVWNPAQGEEAGKTAALADIARQLQVEIETSTLVKEQLQNGVSRTEIRDQARSSSALRLEGVQVEDRCFDAAQATYYVMGRLERQGLLRQLGQQLAEINRAGQAELQRASVQAADRKVLDAIQTCRRVREQAREAEKLSSLVRLLGPTGVPSSEPFSTVVEVTRLQEQLQGRAVVQVRVLDQTGIVSPAVRAVVSTLSLPLQPESGGAPERVEPVLLIRGRVQTLNNTHSHAAQRVWVREQQLVLEVVRLDSAAVVGTVNLTERAGAGSASLAEQRAAQALAQKLDPALSALLKELLAGKGEK